MSSDGTVTASGSDGGADDDEATDDDVSDDDESDDDGADDDGADDDGADDDGSDDDADDDLSDDDSADDDSDADDDLSDDDMSDDDAGDDDVTADPTELTESAIFGRVVDGAGDPISGVSVRAGSGAATTDESGDYALASSTGSAQQVTFSKAGYLSTQREVEVLVGRASAAHATLVQEAPAVEVDADMGGMVMGNRGALVVIPPGALVDSGGEPVTGMVDALSQRQADTPGTKRASPPAPRVQRSQGECTFNPSVFAACARRTSYVTNALTWVLSELAVARWMASRLRKMAGESLSAASTISSSSFNKANPRRTSRARWIRSGAARATVRTSSIRAS